jgi:hypothetical protein
VIHRFSGEQVVFDTKVSEATGMWNGKRPWKNRFFAPINQDMQIPSVPLKRLLFLAKRSQSRWSREGEGANYLDGEREPVH